MWIIPLLLLIVFECLADIFSKQFSLTGKWLDWSLAITGYIVANVFWLFAIRRGAGLARGAVLFSVGSAVVAVLIGLVVFKERVGRVELMGVFVGLVAIVLLLWGELRDLT